MAERQDNRIAAGRGKPVTYIRAGRNDAVAPVVAVVPDVYRHAVETVPRPRFKHDAGTVAQAEHPARCFHKLARKRSPIGLRGEFNGFRFVTLFHDFGLAFPGPFSGVRDAASIFACQFGPFVKHRELLKAHFFVSEWGAIQKLTKPTADRFVKTSTGRTVLPLAHSTVDGILEQHGSRLLINALFC
jgi:hypothetical protein